MTHSFTRRLAVLAALGAISPLAAADYIGSAPATADAAAQASIGFDPLSSISALGTATLPALSAPESFGTGSGSTQSAALGQNVLLTVNNNFDLTLWNFITTVRAQQANTPIPLVQASVNSIALTLDDAVSEVPLPAGAWLFLSGLLGLVGMHAQKRRAAGRDLHAQPGRAAPAGLLPQGT